MIAGSRNAAHAKANAAAGSLAVTEFRASQLGASVLGTGVGLLGFTALVVYLATRHRSGLLGLQLGDPHRV